MSPGFCNFTLIKFSQKVIMKVFPVLVVLVTAIGVVHLRPNIQNSYKNKYLDNVSLGNRLERNIQCSSEGENQSK